MNTQRDSLTAIIGNFPTLQAAEIAAGMLQAHGIPCSVTNATLSSVLPLTETWTPLQLVVPQAMAMKARSLLSDFGDI